MTGSFRRHARRGGAWTLAGEASQRVAQSVTFMALAAILHPAQFGAAATAFFVLQIVYALTYAGIGAAVQALGPHPVRDATSRGFALLSGAAGSLALLLAAAPVSSLMHTPSAVGLIRLTAVIPPTLQYTTVAIALLERDFRFRTTAFAQLMSSAGSVIIGIGLALSGVGPMSLVAAAVGQQVIRFVLIAAADPHALSISLDREALGEIWDIGRHLMATGVAFALYSNIDTFAVGAVLGARALGLYAFAYNAAMTTFFLAGAAANRALMPVLARMKRESEPTAAITASSFITLSWLVGVPLGALAVLGPQLVHVLLGAQWDGADWTLRVLCLAAYLRVAGPACLPVLVLQGRSQLLWRVQVAQLVALAALLYPFAKLGGTVGCAVAVTVPILVGSVFVVRLTLRLAGLHLAPVTVRLLAGPVVAVLCAGVARLAVPTHSAGVAVLQVVVDVAVWIAVSMSVSASLRTAAARLLRQRPA